MRSLQDRPPSSRIEPGERPCLASDRDDERETICRDATPGLRLSGEDLI
ncbi:MULTISPECIES: hypothetical protein [unclassified Streptosporangium]|nr:MULTISPECIES: hypothetical protein [unclassified Streptosporangium]